ncbi:prepilin-type N-terminal cleavage/methylation domain-containing protein [Vibrio sp.]|uniref:type II secretion system protein n=1 Tax=Vibrio sp. TaxID=678 RepID=UPI00311E52FB
MKRNGFSLVELVLVIVILGVLAVTAAPKFLNFQQSARVSVIQGISGAMKSTITQVVAKSYLSGLSPSATNPANQSDFLVNFEFGSVEVDWGNLCPESVGEEGDRLTMVDFLHISDDENIKSLAGNRYTVVGFNFPFKSKHELKGSDIIDLPQGCYAIYDSFGRSSPEQCPADGCVCNVKVEVSGC